MELIKQDGAVLVFRINAGFIVSDSSLSRLDWGSGIRRVSLVFSKGSVSENELCGALPREYYMRIVFSADKNCLMNSFQTSPGRGISLQAPSDLPDLKVFFLKTIEDYYITPFSSKVPPGLRQETREFVENKLSLEGNVFLLKGRERIGLVSLVPSKNVAGKPVDLIPWIWVDERLTQLERSDVHEKIVNWLKNASGNEINAWVDSFNFRSINFFRKLGFLPNCAHITRR